MRYLNPLKVLRESHNIYNCLLDGQYDIAATFMIVKY